MPRASNWNLDADRQLTSGIVVSGKYLRRRGSDELIYANAASPYSPPSLLPLPATVTGSYQLSNLRRDDFESIEISVRRKFSGQYEWMAAYTRLRAVSNALIDLGNAEPLQVLPYLAPMPWDAPNRFLAWVYLPLPWKNWAFSGLAVLRTGFPYSVRDHTDSFRAPWTRFDLHLTSNSISQSSECSHFEVTGLRCAGGAIT